MMSEVIDMFASSDNSNIEKVILEKSEEVNRLLSEQRLMQYVNQCQLINQHLSNSQDQSEISVLKNKISELEKKIEPDIENKLQPLRAELKDLQRKYNFIVMKDIEKYVEIKKQIKSINGNLSQGDIDKVKELEDNLNAPNFTLDNLDIKMDNLRNKIKQERELIATNCTHHYIDYDLIKVTVAKLLAGNSAYFSSREEQQLSLNNKSRMAQSEFRAEMNKQIEKINSPETLLKFMMLLNTISNDYKGGDLAVADIRKTLVAMLSDINKSLLTDVANLKKDIVELKEKRTGNMPHLDLLEESQREAQYHETTQVLSRCFTPVKKKGDAKSDGIYPSKSDYDNVLELFKPDSNQLQNK